MNIRFVIDVYQYGERFTARKIVKRTICPRVGEHVELLSGWGAVTVTAVLHSANDSEVEVRFRMLNLHEESDWKAQAKKQGWKII